jgi:hypothetical protein
LSWGVPSILFLVLLFVVDVESRAPAIASLIGSFGIEPESLLCLFSPSVLPERDTIFIPSLSLYALLLLLSIDNHSSFLFDSGALLRFILSKKNSQWPRFPFYTFLVNLSGDIIYGIVNISLLAANVDVYIPYFLLNSNRYEITLLSIIILLILFFYESTTD